MLAQTTNLNPPPPAAPERDKTDRSIAIGVICTVLFHILLVWLSPSFSFEKFSGVHSGISVNSVNRGKTFDFELEQPQTDVKMLEPNRFVDTNSAAPENTPDKTLNYSSRNQQSAQEIAPTETDPENHPSVTGQDKIKSEDIVAGDMAPPVFSAPQAREVKSEDSEDRKEQKARMEQIPLPGFDKSEGKSEDGIATNISDSKSSSAQADQALEGAKDATDPSGGLVSVTESSKAQPKQRPRLSSTSLNRPNILTNRSAGTSHSGIQAIDAFKTEFGDYLDEVWEIIFSQNHKAHEGWSTFPPTGTYVRVSFRLNADGVISEIISVEETAGKKAVYTVSGAIESRQPYRKWSKEMITLLGTSQVLTFTMYY